MKKVLVAVVLCCFLCGAARAEYAVFDPIDGAVGWAFGRGMTWLYENWNNGHAWGAPGCSTYSCPVGGVGGGGGGGW